MKITTLEQKMLKESMANHGCLDLDFRNPEHYQFFVDRLGGEAYLQKYAPDMYLQIKKQQTMSIPETSLHESDTNTIHLRPFNQIDAPAITVSSDSSFSSVDNCYSMSTISCTLRTSNASDNISNVNSDFRVYDINTGLCIARDYYNLTPNDFGEFNLKVDFSISLEQQNLAHTYQFSSLFIQTASLPSDEVFLRGRYVTSTVLTVNASQYIKKMTLFHPIIRANRSRTKRSGTIDPKDCICVSYNRYNHMEYPDYTYEVSLDHETHAMPVHLPFCLEIELTDDASFESRNNNYFDNSWDPQIWILNLKDEQEVPISTGASPFLADWCDFSQNHVDASLNPATGKINKLTIFFEQKDVPAPDPNSKNKADLWPADLTAPLPDQLWDRATYASFYANISLNISYGNNLKSVLPILVQFMPGMTPSNETKGNNLYIPNLYFQWGCFAKDTTLYLKDGNISAENVHIGDTLLTREGKYSIVRDIVTGPSNDIYKLTLANGNTIQVTDDHTLCLADGKPLTASNVRIGDLLQTFHVDTGTLDASEVIASDLIPYHDTVYNFVFDEPTFLVAQGIIAGDNAYQQKIRPVKTTKYKIPKPNTKAAHLISQLDHLIAAQSDSAPNFSEAGNPHTSLFYYYALKTLLAASRLYTEKDAQEIAEFCAFMESNATYGGVRTTNISDKISQRNLSILADTGFYVKLIPTAMEKWYDSSELSTVKIWKAPASPDPNQNYFSYDVRKDILVPFHYPVQDKTTSPEEDPALVRFCPSFLQDMLEDIIVQSQKGKLTQSSLNMGIGTALHLVLDSMLHENYSGLPSWQNLKRRLHVFDHNRKEINNLCTIYKDYPYEKFSSNENCPTGIEQTGSCTERPFTLFDYSFPLDSSELVDTQVAKTPPYNGYKTFVNSTRFCRALKYVLDFLYRYKGKTLDDLTWKNNFEIPLTNVFNQTIATPEKDFKKWSEEWCSVWKNKFPYINYSYNPDKIYDNLVKGENGDYSELFTYILMLDQIQKGGNLYD